MNCFKQVLAGFSLGFFLAALSASGTATPLLPGALSPAQAAQVCDAKLIGSSAVAACEGEYTDCEFGDCCDHWHASLNWKTSVASGDVGTRKKFGPSTDKYYRFKDGACDQPTFFGGTGKCIYGTWSTHTFPSTCYEENDTVVTNPNCKAPVE